MIELKQDQLVFSFPEVHKLAAISIEFQRTLRIPDSDSTYPLPPGLGAFPLVHVDDYKDRVPSSWTSHGGVIMPMYQAEALWLHFMPKYDGNRSSAYPFAIKISTGKIDAVTGEGHTSGLHRNPQDYVVAPGQPWLDGYCVKKGTIRQFVAMPLGEGYTAEEQITHKAEHGGLQIVVYPMKAQVFEQRFPHLDMERCWEGSFDGSVQSQASWGIPAPMSAPAPASAGACAPMGIAPGGRMIQEIYKDPFKLDDWDTQHSSRCFVHIANSSLWHQLTGMFPPHQPPSAEQYSWAGLPWFDYYSEELKAVPGSSKLANLKSAQALSQTKGQPIPNKPVHSGPVVHLSPARQVREGEF